MKIPEVYADRLVKCVGCQGMYVPRHAHEATLAAPARPEPPARPDQRPGAVSPARLPEFQGMRTDHRVLLQLCQQAKVTGNVARYNFLAAYANAQTALRRDTWQAASFEWTNAHKLLDAVHKARARALVGQAHREFMDLASDQLLDFASQMNGEFERETAHLPPRARKLRLQKIAAAFRNLVRESYRPLVNERVARQVDRIADEWSQRALALD